MLSVFAVLILVTAQQAAQPEPKPAWGLPLQGEEAEHFLRTAKIVSSKSFKTKAVTRPKKVKLIYDTDYKNINNLLVTPDWKIYKIDASRAFRNHQELRREGSLERFSRRVLASLRALTQEDLEENLGRWLTKAQLKALWVRRNLILELADRRVAEESEEAVLFD